MVEFMNDAANSQTPKSVLTLPDQFHGNEDSDCHLRQLKPNTDVQPSTRLKENRIEDRLLADEQPCFIKVGDSDETMGRVVDISPRGMGVVLEGEQSIQADAKVELYFKQFLIIGSVANTVHFGDYVRIGIRIIERHRNAVRVKR